MLREMTPAGFNPSQDAALKKAWDLLSEHFDHALLVIEWETNRDEELTDAHIAYWHGGALPALGMAEYAKHYILNTERKSQEPDDVT